MFSLSTVFLHFQTYFFSMVCLVRLGTFAVRVRVRPSVSAFDRMGHGDALHRHAVPFPSISGCHYISLTLYFYHTSRLGADHTRTQQVWLIVRKRKEESIEKVLIKKVVKT